VRKREHALINFSYWRSVNITKVVTDDLKTRAIFERGICYPVFFATRQAIHSHSCGENRISITAIFATGGRILVKFCFSRARKIAVTRAILLEFQTAGNGVFYRRGVQISIVSPSRSLATAYGNMQVSPLIRSLFGRRADAHIRILRLVQNANVFFSWHVLAVLKL